VRSSKVDSSKVRRVNNGVGGCDVEVERRGEERRGGLSGMEVGWGGRIESMQTTASFVTHDV
jgi:hypothetical protein